VAIAATEGRDAINGRAVGEVVERFLPRIQLLGARIEKSVFGHVAANVVKVVRVRVAEASEEVLHY